MGREENLDRCYTFEGQQYGPGKTEVPDDFPEEGVRAKSQRTIDAENRKRAAAGLPPLSGSRPTLAVDAGKDVAPQSRPGSSGSGIKQTTANASVGLDGTPIDAPVAGQRTHRDALSDQEKQLREREVAAEGERAGTQRHPDLERAERAESERERLSEGHGKSEKPPAVAGTTTAPGATPPPQEGQPGFTTSESAPAAGGTRRQTRSS